MQDNKIMQCKYFHTKGVQLYMYVLSWQHLLKLRKLRRLHITCTERRLPYKWTIASDIYSELWAFDKKDKYGRDSQLPAFLWTEQNS